MKYHEQVDIKILLDKLTLLTDGANQVNKRFSQWTPLEIAQWAFPIVTYCCEMMQILNSEKEERLGEEKELQR